LFVGYEWLDIGMRALRDIEPGEVMQALASQRRRPIPATGPDGHQVLSIWSRTKTGREHRAWEASRDE
jgi:hypothetical protein